MSKQRTRRGILRSYRLYSFVVFFLFVLAALSLVGLLSYRQNRLFYREFIRETNRAYHAETGRLVDRLLYQASYTSAALSDRASVLQYVSTEIPDNSSEERVRSILAFLVSSNETVTSAAVYSQASRRVVSNIVGAPTERTHDSDWIGLLETLNRNVAVLVPRANDEFDTQLLSIARRIDVGPNRIGGIIVDMTVDAVRRGLGFTKLHMHDDFAILNETGTVIFSFRDERIGTRLTSELRNPFVQTTEGSLFNVTYVSLRDSRSFETRLSDLRRYLVLLVLVVSLSGSAIASVLAGIAYRPIREIVDTIEDPDRTRRTIPGEDIRFIEDTIVQVMASNSELEQRLADRFEILRRANYVALQLQMNPHFLSNTLDSLYWTCLDAFPEDSPVPQSLASLSRLLRMLLDTDEMAITLHDEMRLTDQYVTLLETRFRGAIKVRWDVPQELRSHLVPKLLIQPLVENAYYHGIKPTRTPGTVTIRAARRDVGIEVSVTDDGRGMEADRLDTIRANLLGDVRLTGRTIGIQNVAHRLRIMFGDDARVLIDSRLGCRSKPRDWVKSSHVWQEFLLFGSDDSWENQRRVEQCDGD